MILLEVLVVVLGVFVGWGDDILLDEEDNEGFSVILISFDVEVIDLVEVLVGLWSVELRLSVCLEIKFFMFVYFDIGFM